MFKNDFSQPNGRILCSVMLSEPVKTDTNLKAKSSRFARHPKLRDQIHN